MELDLIRTLLTEMLDQLRVQVESPALLLMVGNDQVDQQHSLIHVHQFEVMERKLLLRNEMMITLVVMMDEVPHEFKKLDGHELEEIQEQLILELKIEEMVKDLIQIQPIVMWDQVLVLVATHLVT